MTSSRIPDELALLAAQYCNVRHLEASGLDWFLIETIRTPEGWSAENTKVAFSVTKAYPSAEPYGFYIPTDLIFRGTPPADNQASHPPPFDGAWRFLSWSPVNWRATGSISSGSNLWDWSRTFVQRLKEGH